METVQVGYDDMKAEFKRILLQKKFSEENAERCAETFARNTLEGIYSHGINRFPRFVEYVQKAYVIPNAEPEKVHSTGALEQWNGKLGPGPLNATFCTERAMELAKECGIGCVAIANTNHWMRGGTYGWQAAKKGFVFIGWTNTTPNMPAWGASESKLGNNPLVFAVPFGNEAIVLDFAMTQFSYGKLEEAEMAGKDLPFAGGFNRNNELSNKPAEILKTMRGLPIGYWKGAGLSLLLDIVATILSAGLSTKELGQQEAEHGISQVFIAIDIKKLSNFPAIESTISQIIADYKSTELIHPGNAVRYPGEKVVETRNLNLKEGMSIHKELWTTILKM